MAHKGASVGRGSSSDGKVWDEDFAPDAFAEFDFPRRRITGGKGRSADGDAGNGNRNGRTSNRNGISANRNGRATRNGGSANGNGRPTTGNGRSANINGRSANVNRRSANGNGSGRVHAASGSYELTADDIVGTDLRAPAPSARPGQGVPGRRTVTIKGYGAERNLPWTAGQSRRRPAQPRHQRPGFRADRAAMWAVLLGIMLVVVAAASSHAAVLRAAAARSTHRAPAHVATAAAARSVAVAAPRRPRF
jgi:hypothetical protein